MIMNNRDRILLMDSFWASLTIQPPVKRLMAIKCIQRIIR